MKDLRLENFLNFLKILAILICIPFVALAKQIDSKD